MKTWDEFVKNIENLKVDERFDLSNTPIYTHTYFYFDYESYENDEEKEFSWTMKQKYPYGVMYTYPMKNANCIKTFKTFAGAKRSFLKSVNHYFEKENENA